MELARLWGNNHLPNLAGGIGTTFMMSKFSISARIQVTMTFDPTIPCLEMYSIEKPAHVPNKKFLQCHALRNVIIKHWQ